MIHGGGGLPPSNLQQLLFLARNVDLTLATDQAFIKQGAFTNWAPTAIYGRLKTGAFGVACAGGIYTAAAKGGNAIVAAAQSWAVLTGAGKIILPALAAIATTDVQNSAQLFLSLTAGNTGALTADLFVYGVSLD